jgi:hypothetical protein
MTLRLTLSGGRGFYKALAEGEKPIARAATAAVREAAELSTAVDASVAAAGFSHK